MTSGGNLLAMCATWGFLVLSRAEASEKLSHDIAAQPLAQALSEFATQTGLQFVYVSEIAATQGSKGAPRGLMSIDALQHLLEGTGLRFEFLNDRTVRIFVGSNCVLPSGCAGSVPRAAALAAERPSRPASPPDPLEEVFVTRSRLWLNATGSVAPMTVLDHRDLERGGESSVGDILQALPMTTGSPLNANVNATSAEARELGGAGNGSVRVFLHDLPTLVLLNGRRLPNSGLGADMSVDLNALPMSFIDRVEVLAGSASATYGSDAVGGVVNIVTRRDHHGLELRGTRTIAEHGDGEIVTGQAAMGVDLFGGTWSLGVDYVDQEGVTMDRRTYSANPLIIVDSDGAVADFRDWASPDGRYEVPDGNALGLEPGNYTRVAGTTGQTAADYRPFVPFVDGFNPASSHYLHTPNERTSFWLLGSNPLGESVSFFVEALVNQRNSAQRAAPRAFFRSVAADNYYNPFGELPSGTGASLRIVEAGNRVTSEEVDLWRALIGFEGTVARWRWELAVGTAKSEATIVEKGFFSQERSGPALGPSGPDDSGNIVCGSPDPATGRVPAASIIAGCVPLNLFGGAGSITQAQLDYLSPRPLVNTGTNEQRIAELVLNGPGGRILGRDLRWVLGADYRREAGSLAQDPLRDREDFWGFGITGGRLGGAYDARELFAEMQAPLLHDLPLARDVTLNVGARWSDLSLSGATTTWQAGLRWRLAEELTLRANYAEIFRAPAIVELHDPRVSFEEWWDFDPCGNDPTTPTQQVNCAANGVPGGAYVQGDEGFTALAGGNPELKPETGGSFGVGAIYTPVWSKGFSASIDYFQADLSNYIWRASPDQVLFACAERGLVKACEAIRRHPDGRLSQVATYIENFGGLDVRGLDFAIDWSSMTRLGAVDASVLATYLERWDEQPFAGGDVYSYAGNFDGGARPRWRASGNVDWHAGPWRASYRVEYIGSYKEYVEGWPIFGIEYQPFHRRVDDVLYHDIEAGLEFDVGITVRAAITNVTDQDPPYLDVTPGNTDPATYRLLGRTYFLELGYRFE
jgi:outer membrane cobalamin receptor